MNPVLILVPAAVLIFGPRLWVKRVLTRHDQPREDLPYSGGELARQLLDLHQLHTVKVEITDVGDHYDPEARAVRLSRHRFERRSLTAVTTAAHEVGHALQHASAYGPFIWRSRLAKVSQVTGEVGAALFLTIPIAAITSGRPIPPNVIATTALSILGVGAVAQLTALPTELNASFDRALPMLRQGYIQPEQVEAAREILTACSLTYVASSLLGVLNIWPWLGRRSSYAVACPIRPSAGAATVTKPKYACSSVEKVGGRSSGSGAKLRTAETVIRRFGKPVIRAWFRYAHGASAPVCGAVRKRPGRC